MTRGTEKQSLSFPPEWLTEAFSRLCTLTDRQHATLRLLGFGMDNSMIAQQLSCSERTVKQHITAIFDRLGVDSRLQAGLVAYHDQLHRDDFRDGASIPAEGESGDGQAELAARPARQGTRHQNSTSGSAGAG